MNTATIFRSVVLSGCVTLVCHACVSTQSGSVGDNTVEANKESLMESINSPVYENDTIRFSVVSNGCTRSADFVVEHAIEAQRHELTIVRTKPDLCRKARSLMNIELEWKLQGGSTGMDVVFMNPEIGEFNQGFERKIQTE